MAIDRVNARLPAVLAEHVAKVVGPHGLYETPSEYIRALIRRDMTQNDYEVYSAIMAGVSDIVAGRVMKSTGDWEQDKKLLNQRQDKTR